MNYYLFGALAVQSKYHTVHLSFPPRERKREKKLNWLCVEIEWYNDGEIQRYSDCKPEDSSQHLLRKIKKVIVPRGQFQLSPVPNIPETNQNNYFDMASSNKCFQSVHGLPEIIIRRGLGRKPIKDKLNIILMAKKPTRHQKHPPATSLNRSCQSWPN